MLIQPCIRLKIKIKTWNLKFKVILASEETQAFYKVLGCIEAKEYNQSLVAEEPYDCQLEYDLVNNDHNLDN